jgi:hypothetical protein
MLNVSRQAYLYTIVLLLTAFINMILAAYIFGAVGLFGFIITFLISIPFLLLSVYNIDCLTTGGCNIWSWVVSILSVLSLLLTTILGIIYSSMV